MLYSINASNDATLYRESSSMNTGLDEILEVAKVMVNSTDSNITRALVKFDMTKMNLGSSVAGQRKFELKLFVTEPENLSVSYTLNAFPVSQTWVMGQGKRWNSPQTTEGTSWLYRSGLNTSDLWASGSETVYGGTWYSGSSDIGSQSFNYQSADVNMDVTNIVEQWITGSLVNNGFIVKFPWANEFDFNDYGTLKFFSTDTNTIYKPQLMLKYDDSVNSYGGGTLNADDTVVYVKGIKEKYSSNMIEKIRVIARDRFPARTFQVTQSAYLAFNYLPTSSYYGVKDVYSGQMVVDYDAAYTKLSADTNGNYFNFNFGTLFTNRIYKFVFKVIRGNLTQYFDSDIIFKVVK